MTPFLHQIAPFRSIILLFGPHSFSGNCSNFQARSDFSSFPAKALCPFPRLLLQYDSSHRRFSFSPSPPPKHTETKTIFCFFFTFVHETPIYSFEDMAKRLQFPYVLLWVVIEFRWTWRNCKRLRNFLGGFYHSWRWTGEKWRNHHCQCKIYAGLKSRRLGRRPWWNSSDGISGILSSVGNNWKLLKPYSQVSFIKFVILLVNHSNWLWSLFSFFSITKLIMFRGVFCLGKKYM